MISKLHKFSFMKKNHKHISGQCSFFIIPWDHQNTFGFLMFSGGDKKKILV